MNARKIAHVLALVFLIPVAVFGLKLPFDFEETTPVGSWQIREQTTTDHKGKTTLSVIKSSLVGTEERGGETYYWIETETTNYKMKKGKRSQDGQRSIVKVLMAASALEGDLANALSNLKGLAQEVIIQTGDGEPMKLGGVGFMADAMMKGMGLEIKYDFEPQGTEDVEVPAGSFSCTKVAGTGSAEAKVMFKKMKVESTSTHWIAQNMPFGTVKSVSNDLVNGKENKTESRVIEFGMSGAETQITKQPKEMPNLFGG